jgi:hypothetical protein
MSNKVAWACLGVVGALFAWGLVRLYDLRLLAGDIYPPYSSLRSDPLGAKVLFESLTELSGYTVERNFRAPEDFHGNTATMLWLGEDPFTFVLHSEQELKEFEDLAARGMHVVIALAPVKRVSSVAQMEVKGAAIEKRWGVTFTYLKKSVTTSDDNEGPLPRRTALVMSSGGVATPMVEKQFGKGSVIIADSAYPLSNEALATERNTELVSHILGINRPGTNRTIIFDEHHLGLSENASIAMLARKYRLVGLAVGLLLLAVLFIWRNSSPLLPQRRPATVDGVPLAEGRGSASALQHLLRRNVAESDLIATCLNEWEKSGRDGRLYSQEKLAIIRQLATPKVKTSAVEVYRTMQSVISHRD